MSAAVTAPRIALVAAVADNGVIGRSGALPWHLPDDLKFFKAVTLGKPVLMGRRTYESIGRPLPGRRNLVLSRAAPAAAGGTAPSAPGIEGLEPGIGGVEYVRGVAEACARVAGVAELCVIGGAQVYALALASASRIYLTQVHAAVPGDVQFPLREFAGWREVERAEHAADERHRYAMSFVVLARD